MNLLPDKQNFISVPNQSTKSRKKQIFNLYEDNRIQKTFAKCCLQSVKTKSVCTYQPLKLPASTTVASAKPDVTCWENGKRWEKYMRWS